MKEIVLYCVIGLFLFGAVFSACSKDKDETPEKSGIEKITHETAKEIVDHIQKPINQARAVKNQQETRDRRMEETIKDP